MSAIQLRPLLYTLYISQGAQKAFILMAEFPCVHGDVPHCRRFEWAAPPYASRAHRWKHVPHYCMWLRAKHKCPLCAWIWPCGFAFWILPFQSNKCSFWFCASTRTRMFSEHGFAFGCSLEVLFWFFAVRPLSIRIQGPKRSFSANKSTEVKCLTFGARPKPSISWWKGTTRLKSTRESVSRLKAINFHISINYYKNIIWTNSYQTMETSQRAYWASLRN